MKINKLNYILINLILKIFRIFPVRRNFIFFMGGSYNEFEGNCKSIYEGIKNKSNYNFIILVKNKFIKRREFENGKDKKKEYYFIHSIWIINCFDFNNHIINE